jgi:hypothetical protein
MFPYCLWSGIGPIEDLETGLLEEALKALSEKTAGHWTLWYREGMTAKLVAIWMPQAGIFHDFIEAI